MGFSNALRTFALATVLLVTEACASVETEHDPDPSVTVSTRLVRTVVADGLKSPWAMTFLDERTALVTEKEGGLVKVDLDTGAKLTVDGLPSDLVEDIRQEARFDNGGLFDVARDPDFEREPWIYLSYAAAGPGGRTTKVVRGRLEGNRLTALETLLVAEPFTEGEFFHYGGGLVFGADGKLYVTVGERIYRETSNPPLPIAQDPSDRRGKIYRLNRDGSVPADNPDFGEGSVPGLYAMGIRAAQGMARRPGTGELWFTEHGSTRGDEINRLVPGGNYGWPIVTTGGYRSQDYEPPEPAGETFIPPVWSWQHTVAPTGLAFYEGDEFPEWGGDLLVSGLSRGSLWRFDLEDGQVAHVTELFVGDRVRSRDVAVGPDGSVYMLTDTLLKPLPEGGFDETGVPDGQLLRIDRR